MENQKQCNHYDSDERLLNVLLHYVEERDMPLKTAKEILTHNLIEPSSFDIYWNKFNTILNKNFCKAG